MKRYITASLMACLVGYVAGASAVEPTAVVRQPQGKAAGASAVEPAAVLRRPQGKVFISQGSAMALAQEGMPLYAGNRVIAVSGGRAEIAYADGCVVALPENSLLAVKGADQCRLRQADLRTTSGFLATQIGQAERTVAKIIKVEGAGFVGGSKAVSDMLLYKGNQITAGSPGKVVIRYSNGCEATIEAGQTLQIGDPPLCEPVAEGGAGIGIGAGAIGVGVGFAGLVGLAIANNDNRAASPD